MSEWSNILQMQPSLNLQDLALREQFVREYIRYGDAVEAILALGYMPKTARHMANQFMLDSYVIRRLQELSEVVAPTEEVEAIVTSAIRKLGRSKDPRDMAIGAKLGIEYIRAKNSAKNDAVVASSGVMVVPYLESEESWQEIAIAQQKQLMAEARG